MNEYTHIKENYECIKFNINESKKRVGRTDDILFLAVTKTFPNYFVEEAINCGITDIAENKVQELVKRIDYFKSNVNYHQIGTLQTNKVKYIIDAVEMIHSLDRITLANEINKRALDLNKTVKCLIQVNTSNEITKSGLKIDEVIPFIENILEYDKIKIMGLMTMAANTTDKSIIRSNFRQLYDLKERIESLHYDQIQMKYLSMGMSYDYQIAVEEGANILRIGSELFGQRNYNL